MLLIAVITDGIVRQHGCAAALQRQDGPPCQSGTAAASCRHWGLSPRSAARRSPPACRARVSTRWPPRAWRQRGRVRGLGWRFHRVEGSAKTCHASASSATRCMIADRNSMVIKTATLLTPFGQFRMQSGRCCSPASKQDLNVDAVVSLAGGGRPVCHICVRLRQAMLRIC